jgi:hypothetical protein
MKCQFAGLLLICLGHGYSQGTTCAKVKIQIVQELTLERQGFDAHMRIHNGLDLPLEAVDVDVLFTDRQDQPVIVSTDPYHSSANPSVLSLESTQYAGTFYG